MSSPDSTQSTTATTHSSSNSPENDATTTKKVPNTKRNDDHRASWQRHVRQRYLLPYLPPPVVQMIQRIDAKLAPTAVGPEATVTLLTTLLSLYVTWSIVRWLTARITTGGRAVAEDDQDTILGHAKDQEQDVQATVLLCGPPGVGKTRLFYQFVSNHSLPTDIPTVSSIQANVGVSSSTTSDNHNTTTRIRWVDWPGHAAVTDGALDAVVWKNTTHPVRIVIVVDATHPVAAAAAVLYDVWHQVVTTTTVATSGRGLPLPVLMACHKQDLSKAKTTKRLALQLRTALERVVTTKHPTWWPANTSYAMDDWSVMSPHVTLSWAATSIKDGEPGIQALEDFALHGIVPSD